MTSFDNFRQAMNLVSELVKTNNMLVDSAVTTAVLVTKINALTTQQRTSLDSGLLALGITNADFNALTGKLNGLVTSIQSQLNKIKNNL